jgi:hypothetical protein
VSVSPPILLSLGSTSTAPLKSVHVISSVLTSVFNFFKVFVFPILVFDFLLYLLLLYLLKDADLLQAQEAREDGREADGETDTKTRGPARLRTIQGSHASDVRLLASAAAHVLSWASFETHLTLSPVSSQDVEPVLIPLHTSSALVSIALEDHARYAAAATVENDVLIWHIARNKTLAFPGVEGVTRRRIVALLTHPARDAGSSPPPDFSAQTTEHVAFYSAHEDGELVEWDCIRLTVKTIIPGLDGSGSKPRMFVLSPPRQEVQHSPWPALARLRLGDGRLEIWRSDWTGNWSLGVVLNAAFNADEMATSVAAGDFKLNSAMRRVIATGTSKGLITLWDGDSGLQVVSLAAVDGAVRKLRLVRAPWLRCFTCEGNMADGFFVVVASPTELHVRRIFSPPTDCLPSAPLGAAGPIWPISSPTPKTLSSHNRPRRRSLMAQANDDGSIPMSCHGVRRLSEARKRADTEMCTGPIDGICCRSGKRAPDPLEPCPPIKEEPWGELRIQELAVLDADDARGGWEVCGRNVIGVGKRKGKRSENGAWEVWAISLAPLYSVSAGRLPVSTGPLRLPSPLSPPPTAPSSQPFADLRQRRRRDPLADFSRSTSADPTRGVEGVGSVRLPFSRVQCGASALRGTALAVGLGNSIAILDEKQNAGLSPLRTASDGTRERSKFD